MTATYTFDVFTSLDGYGSSGGGWTGYWGKQGPELLERRLALYDQEQRMTPSTSSPGSRRSSSCRCAPTAACR